ncbi:MAG: 1,6-anhydro-N-acetylmuramyl-L-alanine amidase AmpD [Burkholderiaceae bacterium]
MTEAVVRFSDQGWLYSGPDLSCRWRHSPHHNARPPGCGPQLVVIHGISLPAGDFGGPWVDALFMRGLNANSPYGLSELAGLEVSAHFFISREGLLTQYVSIQDRAWHAGVSVFEGRQNCNDFSIGIELEGTDSTPYTAAQMLTLSRTCEALAQDCPDINAITGHSMIAPDRKTDPGPAFDWQSLADQLRGHGISWRVVATPA